MNFHHLEAERQLQLASLDLEEPWAPDGLTFDLVLRLQRSVYAELARESAAPRTAWLSLSDDEREAIRPRAGLRPVSDQPTSPAASTVGAEGEAA